MDDKVYDIDYEYAVAKLESGALWRVAMSMPSDRRLNYFGFWAMYSAPGIRIPGRKSEDPVQLEYRKTAKFPRRRRDRGAVRKPSKPVLIAQERARSIGKIAASRRLYKG